MGIQDWADEMSAYIGDLRSEIGDDDANTVNDLARLLYHHRGYTVRPGYDFSTATHPQGREAYEAAEIALAFVRNNDTDV